MRRLLLATALLAGLAACGSSASAPAPDAATVTHTPNTAGADPDALAEAQTDGGQSIAKVHCGYVRWNVKTGSDAGATQIDLHPQASTIAAQGALANPLPSVSGSHIGPNKGRYPSEQQTYTIRATLVEFAAQADSDVHLVLADGTQRMVVEIPNPTCVKSGPLKAGITQARKAFLAKYPHPPLYPKPFAQTNQPVTVTGVGFWDYPHGQTGELANTRELHPVIALVFG